MKQEHVISLLQAGKQKALTKITEPMAEHGSLTQCMVKLCNSLPRMHCHALPRMVLSTAFFTDSKGTGPSHRETHRRQQKEISSKLRKSLNHPRFNTGSQEYYCTLAFLLIFLHWYQLPAVVRVKNKERQISDLIQCDRHNSHSFTSHLLSLTSKIKIFEKEFLVFITNI